MSKKVKRDQRRLSEKNTFISNFRVIELPETKISKKKVSIIPRTLAQEDLLAAIENPNIPIVIVAGPAGTGKTLLSTTYAIRALQEGKVKKIIISRPNIPVDDRDIGFLPGDILEKMAPWTRPFEDIFCEYYSKMEYKKLLENGVIEIVPMAFIRGRTFKDAFVIIDEAQGTTPNSLLAILTRIGENSKYVVTGDTNQSDFQHTNGLTDFLRRVEARPSPFIEVVKFTNRDIQRHPAIADILEIYKDLQTNS
jgi:phosphate starvation-inducible PhoH-like protein